MNHVAASLALVIPLDTLTRWSLWAAVVGVGVTIVGVLGAWIGLGVLIRQTDISRTAAEAAKASADAAIAADRAWVIAEIIPICAKFGGHWCRPAGDGWATLSDEEMHDGDHLKHRLKFTNMGRTPAHILSYELRYSCLDKGVTQLSGGSVRNQTTMRPFDRLLAGGGHTTPPELVDVDNYMRDSITGINKLENTAVFYGWVRYQHVFSKTEIVEEPFRYVYRPSTLGLEKVPAPASGS